MTLTQLKQALAAGEWNDVEFKDARAAVPKSAYETVSAFANTHGGWLVFGVAERGQDFEVDGVDAPDRLQNDFLSVLHADQKVNHDVEVTERRMMVDGKTVLAFHIAENVRTRKPVYLDGDIRRTFLRKGGGDYRAQMQDIERLLRDATADRWDSQPFDRVLLEEAFHPGSLRWYRTRFHAANSGFDAEQPDQDFLYHWGSLRHDPPGFRVFREAAINLLIHQDYGDHSRKAVIKFFRDGIRFWNPGDVFGDDSRLWEPGEKEVRNPSIAMAMRRIAMCEQAGTGLRMMRSEWQELGHPAPTCVNDRARKAFELFIPELDKEVDMASDLARAMFGTRPGGTAPEVTSGTSTQQVPSRSPASTRQTTGEVTGEVAGEVTGEVRRLVAACGHPMKRTELQQALGLRHEDHFRDAYLTPALESGLIEMTIPDKPRSSKQKYRLTAKGKDILRRLDADANPGAGGAS